MGAAAATFASVERYGRSCLLSRTEPPAGPPPSEAGSDFPRRSTEPPAVTQRGGPHCNSSAQNHPRRKRGGPRKEAPPIRPSKIVPTPHSRAAKRTAPAFLLHLGGCRAA